MAGLEEEIGGLTQQTAAASERLKQLHRTGAGLRQQLAALREDLHAVEVRSHPLGCLSLLIMVWYGMA